MGLILDTLKKLGIELPSAPKPVASYVAAVRSGNHVYTSGQLPMVDGKLKAEGIVGKDVTEETATECARICAVNALAAVNGVVELDKVTKVVKIVVFVASTPEFTMQPKVANGASEFLVSVFGDKGQHARSAVASPSLPLNTPVEVEMIVEVSD